MAEFTVISHSPEETYRLGKKLGENLRAGDVIGLIGELGAGKTALTQGIARGLDVPEEYPITSPTFTLINEYAGRFMLYHMDMYRLSGMQDLVEIGYDACCNGQGVIVVEWAEKIPELLPEAALLVTLLHVDENKRKILFSGPEGRPADLIGALKGGNI